MNLLKIVTLAMFIIVFNTINAKHRIWINSSLETDMLNKSLKTWDNYLFYSIKYIVKEKRWSFQYPGDFKSVDIVKEKGENLVIASFINEMIQFSTCNKDSQIPPITIKFSNDSSEVQLHFCHSTILFKEKNIGSFNLLHIDKYYLRTLITGKYHNNFKYNDSMVFNFDTIQNLQAFNKKCSTNIIHAISQFNSKSLSNLAVISKFIYDDKIYIVTMVFNQSIVLTSINNKEDIEIYSKNW